jgi:hypothetical protein
MNFLRNSQDLVTAMDGRPLGPMPEGLPAFRSTAAAFNLEMRSSPSRARRWMYDFATAAIKAAPVYLSWPKASCRRSEG